MRWYQSLLASRAPILIGLDISATSVKVLQLSRDQEQYVIQTVGQQPLPASVIDGNRVQDIPGLAHSIQTLLTEVDLWPRFRHQLQAVIAVPDACTIHKLIQVSDRLSDADLEELVILELEKCIPDAMEELYFDFNSIGHAAQPGFKHLLIIAARARYVTDRVTALRQIGLSTQLVDVESLAILRILPGLFAGPMPAGIIAVLDLSPPRLKVFFFEHSRCLLMHEEDFTGLSPSQFSQDLAYQPGLLQRLKRAWHFLYTEFPNTAPVVHMLVAGAGAQQDDLLAWLQSHCDQPLSRANPFEHMRVSPGCDPAKLAADAPLYVTACGLARRVA